MTPDSINQSSYVPEHLDTVAFTADMDVANEQPAEEYPLSVEQSRQQEYDMSIDLTVGVVTELYEKNVPQIIRIGLIANQMNTQMHVWLPEELKEQDNIVRIAVHDLHTRMYNTQDKAAKEDLRLQALAITDAQEDVLLRNPDIVTLRDSIARSIYDKMPIEYRDSFAECVGLELVTTHEIDQFLVAEQSIGTTAVKNTVSL